MTAAPYPTTWPGTAIIKSTHTAFNWRQSGHDQFCPLLSYPTDRAPLYNKWLTARAEYPRSTPDWPEYRDTHAAPARRGPKKKATGGISGHNGTMVGLSARADKLLAVRPDHIKLKINTPGAVKTGQHQSAEPHGGAYSKAKPQKVAV